jgi:erythromycin esterase-like protein
MSTQSIHDWAFPLQSGSDLDPLLDAIESRPYVAIGEASHGTRDYHQWRFILARRLITEKNFRFIVVEWDWPDCYKFNQYVKGFIDQPIEDLFREIDRWPEWMWCHSEAVNFIQWLRQYNLSRPPKERVGFYGFDLFSLQKVLDFLVTYFDKLGRHDLADLLGQLFGSCLAPGNNEQHLNDACRQDIVNLTDVLPTSQADTSILEQRFPSKIADQLQQELQTYLNNFTPKRSQLDQMTSSGCGVLCELEDLLSAMMSVELVRHAQTYYRLITQPQGEANSWNLRDIHMARTFDQLVQFYSDVYGVPKGIILGHNTHIGDARFTNMPDTGMLNLAQLLRESHGDEIYLVGFATYQGTVLAGVQWNGPSKVMSVPPAQKDSWDDLLHQHLGHDSLIIFRPGPARLPHELAGVIGQRVIGATYNPTNDQHQYVPTQLAHRYDALIYLEITTAIQPLPFVNLQ